MSTNHAYAIEVHGTAAGVVVAERCGFQFFAAHHHFMPLDGRVFQRIDQAERAARALGRDRHTAASPVGVRRAARAAALPE